MIAEALDCKIDLIIAKSMSRIARNTVDSLTMARQLKGKGVEIYFEKENIKHGRNPIESRVSAAFLCQFVACLSLESANRYSNDSHDKR